MSVATSGIRLENIKKMISNDGTIYIVISVVTYVFNSNIHEDSLIAV